MKGNISEVISEFIQSKKDAVDPEKRDAEEIKSSLLEKLVEKKFGKTKKK